ncbi:dCTP deaminase [Candidatus Woesearchaeota archaeon]|nr:MAG: deoxycytidine triphosphate deaminase, dCTP deaminase [archaeon GW2011_AR4]MBS3129123.1 dCTP deaminase [Candidatus Woesearchaeota archaeon]HIH37855.1 dCTP deaminase [Candidatus Woesearchaeota archaeon]HIH49248.1 dCTP deaminase [Candidatus Woesearchaeota archaeon]HIJ03980.1 dCTP deaminase [Candidatus Woesearchaeota archaeon]
MILSRKDILKLIEEKKLAIIPFTKSNIGPASIDLTLSDEFRTFGKQKRITLAESTDYKKYSKKIKTNQITLLPGGFLLGITRERISLPPNICGTLTGRSRFARLGFAIHITASFIQPGIDNQQVLEMTNTGPAPLVLKAGTRVCQLVLQEMKSSARYRGKFQRQLL